MNTANETITRRIDDAAAANGMGRVEDVERFVEGGGPVMSLVGGVLGIVVGALIVFGLGTFALALGLLFYVAIGFGLLLMLGGVWAIGMGLVKAVRGATWIGFAEAGAVAVRERQAKVFVLPYDTTSVTIDHVLTKKGKVSSLGARLVDASGRKLTLAALDQKEAAQFNRVLTRFPGQVAHELP